MMNGYRSGIIQVAAVAIHHLSFITHHYQTAGSAGVFA